MHRPTLTLALLGLVTVSFAACDPPPPVAPSGARARPAFAQPSASPALASSASVTPAAADKPAGTGYDKPPQNVLDVLRAPSPPVPYVSPTGDTILLVSWVDYPPMSRVAEPFLRLAGVRVEP